MVIPERHSIQLSHANGRIWSGTYSQCHFGDRSSDKDVLTAFNLGNWMNESQHRQLMLICERPGLFVRMGSFTEVCSYIDGIHAANGCLVGFREWLIVRLDTGNNLIWEGLVSALLKNEEIPKTEYVDHLGQIINEFYEFTGSTIGASTGLMRVYVRYHGWLLKQRWYKPEWIGYVAPFDGTGGE